MYIIILQNMTKFGLTHPHSRVICMCMQHKKITFPSLMLSGTFKPLSPDLTPSDMSFESLSRNSTEMLDDQSSVCSIEISASRSTIIKNSVKIFEQQLKNKWTRQKIPKGMKKKFQQTLVAGRTVTSRIFFDNGGFKAWFAYFLATEGKAHFKGRHDRSVTITAFQQLSLADQADVARKVANKQPHSSVAEAIHKISRDINTGNVIDLVYLLPLF